MSEASEQLQRYKDVKRRLWNPVPVTTSPTSEPEPKPELKPELEPKPYKVYQSPGDETRILLAKVCQQFQISHDELVSPCRGKRFVSARAVAAHLLRDRGWSLPQIAKRLKRSDHGTIYHLLASYSPDGTPTAKCGDIEIEFSPAGQYNRERHRR